MSRVSGNDSNHETSQKMSSAHTLSATDFGHTWKPYAIIIYVFLRHL